LNVTEKSPSRKAIRLKPSFDEGLSIQYHLKRKNYSFVRIGNLLNKSPQSVRHIVFGQRHSACIEAEIVHILGKADWNDVVLEARSEVQKKPVEVILEEMRQAREERRKNQGEIIVSSKSRDIDVLEGEAAVEFLEKVQQKRREA